MSKADGNCNRCHGTGFRDSPRAHLGVPGLCFGCDGIGTYSAFEARRAAARKKKIENAAYDKFYNMVNEVAEKNGGMLNVSRERRATLRNMSVPFTTVEYAIAAGITPQEAWVELCRIGRGKACPVIGPDLKPIGWTNM